MRQGAAAKVIAGAGGLIVGGLVLGVQVAPIAPSKAIEEGRDLVVENSGGEGGGGDDAAKVVEHGWSSLAGVEKGDGDAGGFTVQLLDNPEGEVDVDALELQALTAGLAQVEGAMDGIAVIKALIELRSFHRGESPQVESGEKRSGEGWHPRR